MKKLFACAAVLSLALVACGDDASSTAPDQSAGGESSSSETVLSSETPSSSDSEESSSSVESVESSSGTAESSSAEVVVAGPHSIITDANAQCGTKGVVDDPMLDGDTIQPRPDTVDIREIREERMPPFTYRYVGTERSTFTIENLSLTCGITVDTLDVHVSGDTVVVRAKFDFTNAQRCICPSKIDFAVDNDDAYARATLLSFDNGLGSLSPEIMDIVDMDVVLPVDTLGRKQAKDIDLSCLNVRAASAPTKASATELPGKIDTTEKILYASRKIGDDGFDTIVINEVTLPCAVVFERFDVYVSDGTLYVEPKLDPDSPITNCICPTRVSFRIEQNEAFLTAERLVFDGGVSMPITPSVRITVIDD